MKNFLILTLVVLQSIAPVHASRCPVFVDLSSAQVVESPSALVVDLTLAGYHQASWDPMSGSGNYNLIVVNLATNQMHCSVSTPNTSMIIVGLTTGSYMFLLSRGSSTTPSVTINVP